MMYHHHHQSKLYNTDRLLSSNNMLNRLIQLVADQKIANSNQIKETRQSVESKTCVLNKSFWGFFLYYRIKVKQTY